MEYSTFDPADDLKDLVRFWWTVDSPIEGPAPHRLLAECCPNIVVIRSGSFHEADGSSTPAIHLAGALSKATNNTGNGPFTLFGIYLWPWAVRVLFGLAAEGSRDNTIDLADHVQEDERTALTGPDKAPPFDGAAQWLRRLRGTTTCDRMIETIVRAMVLVNGKEDLGSLVAGSGLARRQFERRFKESTGFSPGLFQRIVRFQRTYRSLERGVASNLTEVALEAGYFDQSHFIRDFKRFSGMDPKTYFRKLPEKVDNFVRLA